MLRGSVAPQLQGTSPMASAMGATYLTSTGFAISLAFLKSSSEAEMHWKMSRSKMAAEGSASANHS